MSTPKQPVINPVLITYIDYSITENDIGKMASFLPYTHPVNMVSVGAKGHRRNARLRVAETFVKQLSSKPLLCGLWLHFVGTKTNYVF
jgi:hypothetical protein